MLQLREYLKVAEWNKVYESFFMNTDWKRIKVWWEALRLRVKGGFQVKIWGFYLSITSNRDP